MIHISSPASMSSFSTEGTRLLPAGLSLLGNKSVRMWRQENRKGMSEV